MNSVASYGADVEGSNPALSLKQLFEAKQNPDPKSNLFTTNWSIINQKSCSMFKKKIWENYQSRLSLQSLSNFFL